MSRFSSVESAHTINGERDGIDDRIEVRSTYWLQISDDCTVVEGCQLSVVEFRRLSWEGSKIDSLKVNAEQLAELQQAIAAVLVDRERVERKPPSEVDEIDPVENPSNGETFVVTGDGVPLDPSVLD